MFKSIQKHRIVFISVMLFSLAVSFTAFAARLEVDYPLFNGEGPATGNLPGYIRYVFLFAVSVAGIIGVISLAIAGIQILLSAGNPSAISDARDRLFSAVLGIVLLLLSFVILNTINPQLTEIRFDAGKRGRPVIARPAGYSLRPGGPGGFNDFNPLVPKVVHAQSPSVNAIDCESGEWDCIDAQEIDEENDNPDGSYFAYLCDDPDSLRLFLSVFPNEEFTNDLDPEAETIEISCGESFLLDGIESFEWDYFAPEGGIYLFLKPGCLDTPDNVISEVITDSRPLDGEFADFADHAQSALIINDNSAGAPKYGFFLHEDAEFIGSCTGIFQNIDNSKSIYDPTNEGQCFNIATCQAPATP